MKKDVIIIGAGVNGCYIAYLLARYELNVLVIEKESDVCEATSGANSAIIHSGYDPEPGTWKAKLNVLGNPMFDEVCKNLDVEFERIGSLTVARSEQEINVLKELQARGNKNGVVTHLLSKNEVLEKEPNINPEVMGALFAPSAGIINPFELCVGLMENAVDHGVELHLNEEVVDIKKDVDGFFVKTNLGKYTSRIVVNAAGLYADKMHNFVFEDKQIIKPRKGEYFILDHFNKDFVQHVLFSVPSDKGKGTVVVPTTHRNYMIGPTSHFVEEKEDVGTTLEVKAEILNNASKLINRVPTEHIIRTFSGLRAYHPSDDFVIDDHEGFINVLGMQSPGLAAVPATASMVVDRIGTHLRFVHKDGYTPTRRPVVRLSKCTKEEKQQLTIKNSEYGRIICRCEQVSLAEIKDAIHRNVGARTVKGVKKRIRPGFGRCQGGFCEAYVVDILATELNISKDEVVFSRPKATILLKPTKGGASHETH